MPAVLGDSAVQVDALGRHKYVAALTNVLLKCETPFVLGIYGEWGSGKTSVLQLLRNECERRRLKCVWFNAWLHQSDENPALALLHEIAHDAQVSEAAKKTLAVVGETLASAVLKVGTTIQTEDIRKVAERYEAEKFAIRDAKTRLRERFESFISSAKGANDRLVIFIDDLDRCRTDVALSVLEAIQLYLNISGCVFVIAADRAALERVVAIRYGEQLLGGARFLDKIVQLPFSIPPLHESVLSQFLSSRVDSSLRSCVDLIIRGVGANPRAVKRFVNVLALNHELAQEVGIEDYDVEWLCGVLLIQYLEPDKFALVVSDSEVIEQIRSRDEGPTALYQALTMLEEVPPNISEYVHLTTISGTDDVSPASGEFMRPMRPSPLLAAIVGPEPQPRTEITSKLWAYIKKNGLQDEEDRRLIHADALLRPIFEAEELTMFQMTKKVAQHLA